jgi:NADP-dependent 3-hydroxy acid dehydrogenase YdfG
MLITGATSGLGEATARAAARAGWGLILTGRREDRLERLGGELAGAGSAGVQLLGFDVRDRGAAAEQLGSIPDAWVPRVLVNNAGLAVGRESVEAGDYGDWDRMLDTNVKGVLHVVRELVPRMGRGSRVIQVGSIAGRQGYAGGAVYNASKFAVDGLTQAMRLDLLERGIQVSQVLPGAAETEFSEVRYHGDKAAAAQVYLGFTPLQAADVAEAILFIASRPPHVSIHDIVIMPAAQASAYHIHRETLGS